MITQLATAALSNACFALVLAIVAVVLGRKANRPQFAHLLWLLRQFHPYSNRITCQPDSPPTGDGKRHQQWRYFGTEV